MPINKCSTAKERTKLRSAAWKQSLCGVNTILGHVLAFASAGLAVARATTSDDEQTQNIFFIFEMVCFGFSLVLQYYEAVENLRDIKALHYDNAQEHSGGYKNPAGKMVTGLLKGVRIPVIVGVLCGIAGGIATGVTFFKGSKVSSEILGVVTPVLASFINDTVKSRLEIERQHLMVLRGWGDDELESAQHRGTAVKALFCRL